MRKLTIIFKDKSKIVYTMKNSVPWEKYFSRHSGCNIESAVLQTYPKKKHEPVILV